MEREHFRTFVRQLELVEGYGVLRRNYIEKNQISLGMERKLIVGNCF